MDRWCGKLAVVTGASSGIGESIAIALLQNGVNVVGLARRLENMEKLKERMKKAMGIFYPVQCDLSKEQDILDAFEVVEKLGGADILVNNAAVSFTGPISDGVTSEMKMILDVNVLAVAICSREAVKSLKKRGAAGHIININSYLGHNPLVNEFPINLYETSKHAITGMSDVLRREMGQQRLPIKVTSLSPGLVKTDLPVMIAGESIFEKIPHLQSKDIADAVIYILGTSPNAQVHELTILALHGK